MQKANLEKWVDELQAQIDALKKQIGSGGAATIGDLEDVTITTPAAGDLLVYDSTAEVWTNEAAPTPPKYTRTLLYQSSGDATYSTAGIELTGDIEDYDAIEIILGFATSGDKSHAAFTFGAKWFADEFAYTSAASSAPHALLMLWANQGLSAAWDSENSKMMLWGQNGNAGIYAIYGLTY